jgi:hypothetical protein
MAQVTKYDEVLELKLKEAELLQEQVGLLQRLREIELEMNGVVATQTVKAAAPAKAVVNAAPTGEVVRRRGRPPGTGKAAAAAATKAAGVATDDGKSVDLPTLLETIAQQVNRPLLLADFVTLARQAGYTTKAKDFSNMVYQSVLKLVKKGLFRKNDETRAYEYVGKAA